MLLRAGAYIIVHSGKSIGNILLGRCVIHGAGQRLRSECVGGAQKGTEKEACTAYSTRNSLEACLD